MPAPTLSALGLEGLSGVECGWGAPVEAATQNGVTVALCLRGKLDTRARDTILSLGHLQHLDLGQSTGVSNAWFAKLGELPHLRSLDVWRTSFGDAAARGLARSPSLESLDVRNTKLGEPGLVSLAGIATLRHLLVGVGPGIPLEGLRALGAAPSLESLSILRPPFTFQTSWLDMETVVVLSERRSLRALALYGVVGDGDGIEHLEALPNLTDLGLGGNWHRDGRHWMEKLRMLRRVEHLDLSHCSFRSLNELEPLAGLESLREVGLYGATFVDPALPSFKLVGVRGLSATGAPPWSSLFPRAAPIASFSEPSLLGAEGKVRPPSDLRPPALKAVGRPRSS